MGVYALIRVFSLIFVPDEFLRTVISGLGALTLISGGLGALVQTNMRKMFSYQIVCHIGYMIGGLGMFTATALTGAIFYIIHDIVLKTNLFLISGVLFKITGEINMKKMGNLYSDYPVLSLLFAIPLFSLVGIPPLSGFWPKIDLFKAAFFNSDLLMVAALIFGSFITLFVIARFWSEAFWKHNDHKIIKPYIKYFWQMPKGQQTLLILPIVFLSFITLYIGLGAENIYRVAQRIAEELMDTSPYVNAVMGIQP